MNIVKKIKAANAAKKALRRRKFKMFQAEDRFEWPRATK